VTLEGVKALSDEELRSKAAECLGARWYRSVLGSVVGRYLYIVPESRPGVEIDSIPADGTEPLCGGAMKYIPDYPHDIAAAWELIDEAEKTNRGVSLFRNDKGVWEMAFSRERPELRMPGEKFIGANDHATGETAPLAITRAFVLAMTQEA
jgi:hypothetical protein